MAVVCLALFAAAGCDRAETEPAVAPRGAPESDHTNTLEVGAALLQDDGPTAKLDIHLVGFHPMKAAPDQQMEAHHFCRQVNEDFAQCALFDGSAVDANLTGIEYIISERSFQSLPEAERAFWHPHNGEILSGQLVAPGLPVAAETALMRSKINSYGKTWHTWHTRHGTRPGDRMPVGPAALAWSFSRDGEIDPALVASRDTRLGIDTAAVRARRQPLIDAMRPQRGVDTLQAHFPASTPIDGVVEAAD
ncbi:MAG: OBAP family protein [Luteimonas sp.]